MFLVIIITGCTNEGAWDLMKGQIDNAAELTEELSGWKKRIKITIDNSSQGETLTEFPVLVKLNSSNITYGDFKPGGSDLSFYSAALDSRLDYEIDTWNTSGDSFIWVKIPSIAGSSSNGYFWLYYSSDINTGTEDAASVWSDNYRGVWHLGESGTSYADSSPYNNTGTGGINGQNDPVVYPSGIIGSGQDQRDPADKDSIAVSADPSINDLGPLSYSFWIYNSGSSGDYLLSKENIELRVPTNTKIGVVIQYSGGPLYREFECMPGASWTYIAITWDGMRDIPEIWLYSNGSAVAPGSSANTSGTRVSDAGYDLYIGNDNDFGAADSKDCMLDEFRISGKVRSADWVYAQYLTQSGSFLTLSAVEDL